MWRGPMVVISEGPGVGAYQEGGGQIFCHGVANIAANGRLWKDRN